MRTTFYFTKDRLSILSFPARAGLPLTDCRFMLRSDNYRNRSVNQCYEI